MIIVFILLAIAMVLAPVIGGGFGELANGIIQTLVFVSVIVLFVLQIKKDNIRKSGKSVKSEGGNLCNSFYMNLPVMLFCAFLIWVVLSSFFTESIYYSLKQLLFYFACFSGFMAAITLSKVKKNAIMLTLILAATSFGISLYGIRDYAISTGGGELFWKALTSPGDHMRLFGTFINPGFFSGYLVLTIPISLSIYLICRKNIISILAAIMFVFQIIALLLTGTKFGVLACIISIIVLLLLILITRNFTKSMLVKLVVMLILFSPVLYLFSKPVASRVAEAQVGGSEVHSTNFRIYTWKAVINMANAHPIVGVGSGMFEIAFPRYAIAGITKHAHQGYLQLASECGYPAVILFLAALLATAGSLIKSFLKTGKIKTESNVTPSENTFEIDQIIPDHKFVIVIFGVFSGIVGSCIRNLVDSDWFVIGIAFLFWVMLGILVGSLIEMKEIKLSKAIKIYKIAALAILIIISISFAGGDYYLLKYSESEDSYTRESNISSALSMSPMNPRANREIAKTYAMDQTEQDKKSASYYFEKAIKLSPTDGANYFSYGYSNFRNNNYKHAAELFNEALKCNPKSTQTLYQLAQTYKEMGNTKLYESTLFRLLSIENTPYELVKGVPEMVDVTYAYAHAYFGKKYLSEGNKQEAAKHLKLAIDRLENWKKHEDYMKIAKMSGYISEQEIDDRLNLLDECKKLYAESKK